ncbi:MAG: efflux RND transporter periplasmic adaptor subunit, partial [Flavobacteriales bacterium]
MPNFLKLIIRFSAGGLILIGSIVIANAIVSTKPERPIGVPSTAQKIVEVIDVGYTVNNFKTPVQGRVQAKQSIELFSEVSGPLQIGGKEFREGQEFNKGEAILRMDPTDQVNQVKSLRSAFLQLLTANLADIKIDYPSSFPNWSSYVNEFDINKNLASLPTEQSQQEKLFLSNRGILNQFYNIKSAEDRLAKYTVRAPFKGKVIEALVSPGALVRVGQKMGAFASSGQVEIEAAVGVEVLNYLNIGDPVLFMVQNDSITGVVKRVSASLDPST